MTDTIEKPEATTARWKATIYYRSEAAGLVDVEHGIEEIADLHDIVERGPNWHTIERIEIVLDRYVEAVADLTIEQADTL